VIILEAFDAAGHLDDGVTIEEYLLAARDDPLPQVLRLALVGVARARSRGVESRTPADDPRAS